MSRRLSASVVVSTSSHDRETLLRACVSSLTDGTRVPDEVLVVVDQNPSLQAHLAEVLPAETKLLVSERAGLSGSRNAGARAATSDVVVFVDDDATVERDWLSRLIEPFESSADVLGVGGAVVPAWGVDQPWLPEELLWLVGCTYRGHREDAGPIRNPIGCNMAFRRRQLVAMGGFATQFGRQRNVYCDETELSLRLERAYGAGRIRYAPLARVRHHVPSARLSWRVLGGRCVREGLAKGRLHRLYKSAALDSERGYARRLLLQAAPRLLVGAIRRHDGRSLMGTAAILLALLLTGAAFVAGAAVAGGRQARVSLRSAGGGIV
jgi:GT2 family glycosyltransferase